MRAVRIDWISNLVSEVNPIPSPPPPKKDCYSDKNKCEIVKKWNTDGKLKYFERECTNDYWISKLHNTTNNCLQEPKTHISKGGITCRYFCNTNFCNSNSDLETRTITLTGSGMDFTNLGEVMFICVIAYIMME